MSDRVGALILAAGASRRLGQPKAMLSLPTGETLLARAVASARQADLEALVAVPPGDNDVAREAARLGAPVAVVADPAAGMSASIRAGIERLEADPGISAVLMMLADQWRLTAGDLTSLLAAWRESPSQVAAARYSGRLGVPAVFGRGHFPSLASLEGDRGARDLLRSSGLAVTAVDLPSAEADLDTPAQIPKLASARGIA